MKTLRYRSFIFRTDRKSFPRTRLYLPVAKEEAAKNTIAYSILKAHNKSDNMEKTSDQITIN